MPKTATIQTRIDPEVKTKAMGILNQLNISMSEAISLFLTQVSLKRGIPFEINVPNELTVQTLRKSDKGKDLVQVSSMDHLFEELDR